MYIYIYIYIYILYYYNYAMCAKPLWRPLALLMYTCVYDRGSVREIKIKTPIIERVREICR